MALQWRQCPKPTFDCKGKKAASNWLHKDTMQCPGDKCSHGCAWMIETEEETWDEQTSVARHNAVMATTPDKSEIKLAKIKDV